MNTKKKLDDKNEEIIENEFWKQKKAARIMKNNNIRKLHEIAKIINSPLSPMDIGLLIEYKQTGASHFFDDYMLIQNIWDILNGKECSLENLSLLIENKERSELESILVLLNKMS